MTDFMQDPLWEEEGKDPEPPKAKAEETDKADLMAAGNAALAQSMAAAAAPEPVVQALSADAAMPAAPKDAPQPEAETPPEPVPDEARDDPPLDWETPLSRLFADFTAPALQRRLPAFLDTASAIPADQTRAVAAAITSAFLRLPALARKPVRDVLVATLKRWPGLPVARLILTRIAGIAPALAEAPAPPPPPPADP